MRLRLIAVLGGLTLMLAGCSTVVAKTPLQTDVRPAIIWQDPTDLESRNLFYGPGGEGHQPHGPFTFVREDNEGTNPKFVVRDRDGLKWKIKLGPEARPETVASRLVWAVGYGADEDYFLDTVQVQKMPAHVHRGQKLIGANGVMHGVRMKGDSEAKDKLGDWSWRDNPFTGTRELNGLRVLMAVINNWDLKDVNTAIVDSRDPVSGQAERVYEISDLGSSFGAAGLERNNHSTGELEAYRRTRFITRRTEATVDFGAPRRADWILLVNPHQFVQRLNLRWIGEDIPRQDARWMGQLLGQLSPSQIRDAFRAGGYSPEDVEGFAAILASRIEQLNEL